ncbi:MAG: hypothetical protein O2821_01360 [Chloroflexi bacterium]|nr:hypothetical protein [Chloroflexota bacterium]MDA1227127.1 hypothetical protein [Chloroflexota bacterium]
MAEQMTQKPIFRRGWLVSLIWATVVVGVSIILSATVNPLFERYVHWDWMAFIAPVSFVLLTLAFRRRWV